MKKEKQTQKVENTNKKQEALRALKFFLFSCSAGVIQFGVFTLLSEVVGWDFWPSHLIALVLSVVWNFTFNRKFTFKSAANVPKAMLLAFLFYIPFTPATVFGGQALVDLGWNSLLVEALTMVLNLVLEFFYSKYVTFRNNIDTATEEKKEPNEEVENKDNADVNGNAENESESAEKITINEPNDTVNEETKVVEE